MFWDFVNIAQKLQSSVFCIASCWCCALPLARDECWTEAGWMEGELSNKCKLVVIESQSSEFNIRTGERPNWFWITGLSQQHHLNRRRALGNERTNKDDNNIDRPNGRRRATGMEGSCQQQKSYIHASDWHLHHHPHCTVPCLSSSLLNQAQCYM